MRPARVVVAAVACFVVALCAAHPALACAVCGGAKSDNDWAFGITTLILSLMPPALFAGFVIVLVRAHKKRAREDAQSFSTPAE